METPPVAAPGGNEPAGEPAETPVSALQVIPPGASLPDGKPPQARSKPEPIQISSVLGAVEVLSDADQIELYACEAVVETASSNVFQVGLAVARIRDGKLDRMEFQTFEAYCHHKWQAEASFISDEGWS